ncbi:DNA glycosylase/AP lyase ROS1-like [Bidens hawaiensis]|uniref:DNA glycosylase/AP lyase ROS1-like n=1 Tax=Bidens hawaiensis TaxID=980011 RepID=UPI00404A53A0
MTGDPLVNTGLSLQFTPLTPDLGKSMNLAAGKDVEETNKDSKKGLCEQTNLNGTPQPKQKRRKHRPKVVTEGTPKRARKPATPKPDGSTTGKRKYIRRKGIEKSPTTPGVDETGGGVHPSPDQETKKTCKRKIDFDESEKQEEVTVDKTSTVTSEVVENHQKVHETGSPSPITPTKPELPPKSVKRQYTKAKCKITFLEETHDKVPSHLPSPNEPGCSTSVCNKGDEVQRSIDGIKLWNGHNVGMFRDNLESFLSLYTDYNCNMQPYASDNNKGKTPEMPKRGYNQARSQNSKNKKITMQDMVTFGGYQQQHTYIESNVAGYRVSNIKNKKQAMAGSFYYNHLGYNQSIYGIDALIRQFEQLHINRDAGYHEKNALVVYQHGGSLVPYDVFNPIKKTKHRPKVDLDDETNRVWMLLLEDINGKGVDGNDEDKAKWWEEERRVFRGRADSFIARMHLVQGDRRFSPWKGSVLDSVVGVFLTQNVSDHLSSSAFMSLAARFPLKENSRSEPVNEGVVNNDEFSKSCLVSVELNEKSECEVAESFEKIANHAEVVEIASSQNSVVTCCMHKPEEQKDECEANVGGPVSLILHMQESTRVYEKCGSEESGISVESASHTMGQVVNTISSQESATSHCSMEQQDLIKINLSTESFTVVKDKNAVEALEESVQKVVDFHNQTIGQVVNTISSQESATSHCCMVQQDLETINPSTETSKATKDKNIVEASEESVQKVVDFHGQTMGQVVNTISSQESANGHCCMVQQDLETINPSAETSKATKDKNIVEASEESVQKVVDFNSQTMCQVVNTISSQESATSHCCMVQQYHEKINLSTESVTVGKDKNVVEALEESVQKVVDFHSQTMGQVVTTISSQESANSHCCKVQQDLENKNLSTENFTVGKDKNTVEVSEESVQKVVDFSNNKTNGADEGSSKVKKKQTGKSKSNFDWSKLFEGVVKRERERSPNSMDSMDYEAIRAASVNDVAETIKERGMHFRLAERIKDMLDRLVRDHGSTDLEWLRDIPPDKAKEYLLSFAGLGLKSVECIRLLTLHHLAFPVDTNVGRIAVRLGWVPLQALPESLQLHLLELYPVQETIQKYLWPRLCKLDQKTLYELHYQMITFGKVFCTKTKPNCNACPMRGECRHFASAFASARLALPAPENKTGQNPIAMIDLPSTRGQPEQPKQPSEAQNCNAVIEEPTTPGPIVEVPATPGRVVEVPATQAPIVEMPASPEPEQIQQEVLDIEDFNGDDEEEIPMIKLNIEEFTQNLQTYMESHMELGECDLSKALVALTPEAASIPTPKLKNVSQLRTEHQVYELPDSHPLLEGLDKRETDDPCPYLLAVWTPGETADSIQPPEGQCCSQESGIMCNQETCFFCISTREANSQTIRGTLLIPCRTANRGSFPLNGTYFQVNEVFADHESSLNPIDVPRAWLWNLPKRTVYFGTSVPSIFKGKKETQMCFWRGFVCVRGYDRKERAPRPLRARLHFPASRLKQQPKPKTDQTRS